MCSSSAVDPLRSANITVTTLRAADGAGADGKDAVSANDVPQASQKRPPGTISLSQTGHRTDRLPPQYVQNRAPSRFFPSQLVQIKRAPACPVLPGCPHPTAGAGPAL